MATERYKQGVTELLAILDDEKNKMYTDMIPEKLMDFFRSKTSKTYQFHYDSSKELKDIPLKSETKNLLAMLYLNYWCENQEEKKSYMQLLKQNEIKYSETVQNTTKTLEEILAENKNQEVISTPTSQDNNLISEISNSIVPSLKEESFFRKMINKIRSFFHFREI
ncbi:MAG: hypothetical protein IJ215_01000 [Clostridia bacterium]|nr:hypothetical protein [Clostridia bacterium]